jgi:hypothetical protein
LDAIQTYEDSCIISSFNGGASGSCPFKPIPSGKRLVIQEFDAYGYIDTGSKPIVLTLSTPAVAHSFTPTFLGNYLGADFYNTHQETRLYVAPSQTPTCGVSLSGTSSSEYHCALSGFFVDVQ